MSSHAPRAFPVALAVTLLLFVTQGLPVHNLADSIGYFAYLRSSVVDLDFHFLDEYRTMGMMKDFLEVSPTGVVGNPFACGAAILWLPFFLLTHLVVAAGGFGGGVPASGFGALYYLSVSLGTLAYAVAGVVVIARAWPLATGTREPVPRVALVAAAAGTPVVYYALRDPMMPHALCFFTVSLALYAWLRADVEGRWWWFYAGWAAGMAAAVRTQNILFLAVPVMDRLLLARRGDRRALRSLPLLTAGAIAGFAPQMVVWRVLNGGILSSSEGIASLEWRVPRFAEVLFAPFHGAFLWSPVMLLGLVGLAVMLRSERRRASLLIAFFLAQLALNGLVKVWWGGVSFGHRQFLATVPVLAIGMGIVARASVGRILLALGTAWGMFLFLGLGGRQVYLGAPQTLPEMIGLGLRTLFSGGGEIAYWVPALSLPRDLRMSAAALAVLAAAIAALLHRLARRDVGLFPVAIAFVAAVTLFWGIAGYRTLKLAPALRPETERSAAGSAGVERYIASTSRRYDGLYALSRGDLARAERDFRQAAAAWPRDPAPLHLLAGVLRKTGREKLAGAAERMAGRLAAVPR